MTTASTNAPAAPAGLTATGGDAQVSLSWAASSGVSSYIVYRGTASGRETQLATGVVGTVYADKSVAEGTTYYYEVAAVNQAGPGARSVEVTAAAAAQKAPAAPTGLTATGGDAQIALSWTGTGSATSYSVFRGTASGKETQLATGVAGTTYTDKSVTGGTTYYYEVAAASGAGTSGMSNEASAAPASSAADTMTIQSPNSPTVITANQVTAGELTGMAISDADASTSNTSSYPIRVTAPGMENVELYTHGQMATRLTDGGNGVFSGTLDLSAEPTGPLHVSFEAWNTPPGDNSYTVNLVGELTLFVTGTVTASPASTTPAGAAGMQLAWSDEFDALKAGSCLPNTGAWPSCTYVSASDGYTWFESLPVLSNNYGDAAFEVEADTDQNPFTVVDGFLRIRSTYDPSYVDPYGFGRRWHAGLLSTTFPDQSSGVPIPLADGYYEARILVPNSSAGSNQSASGGTWPAFWMLNTQGLESGSQGSAEIDVMEQYGVDPGYEQAGEHAYGDATNGGWIYRGDPGPDLTTDFHRYGVLISTSSNTATVYMDDKLIGSAPLVDVPGVSPLQWYMIVNLAMGAGYPDNPPPGGYYDMWIDYVRYYR